MLVFKMEMKEIDVYAFLCDLGQCLELHVLCVPIELWNSKRNTISSEVIDNFISAGLIRVYPDITLKALRDELGVLLGGDILIDRYSFLKCVGRSLALVKPKQERELKVKAFSPPYAPYPELYLLPSFLDISGSTRSHSHTSEMQSYSSNPHTSFRSEPLTSIATESKEPVRFPEIKKLSNQPPTLSLDGNGGGVDDDSLISSEDKEEDGSSYNSGWGEDHSQKENIREQLHTKKGKNSRPMIDIDKGIGSSPNVYFSSLFQTSYDQTPFTSLLSAVVCYAAVEPSSRLQLFSSGQELMEEVRMVMEERKQLERIRQDLLRKGKDLLALNRHRRNQARNGWKRKYFDTKKATAPLEESLKNVRQELETFYNKLLQQLQAREGRKKHRHLGKVSSIKNDLIIQIMTESYEIDDLRRKVEDCKMKLETEQKLRVQAATERQTLKAELASKKSQPSVYKSPVDVGGSGQQYTKPPAVQKQA
ncbi:spermatogenesis-associated protein 1 [Alosa pseudoharengus]|uniref:spermatogenesis-associated protein 1 n=1 Tax=Alosa pseudoharengus TaxID=34774 RepID=UPI003F8BF10A